MPLKSTGKKKKKRTKPRRKKKEKPKILEPYEMPDIIQMMTKQRFYKLKLKNKFENTGSVDFENEFSEMESILNIKEYLQQKIYQRAKKIFIFEENSKKELEELDNTTRIKDLQKDPSKVLHLVYSYELPPSFIRNKL
jgi:hypothetical protein